MRTTLSTERAESLVAARYGLAGRASPLPSYADTNFRIDAADGRRFILRVAHTGELDAAVAFQHSLLARMATSGLAAPRVVLDADGRDWSELPDSAGVRLVRLHTWIEGRPLAECERPPESLFAELGRFLGRMSVVLRDVATPAPDRGATWDLTRAPAALADVGHVRASEHRALATACLERFRVEFEPRLAALPRGVIHNDANDHNVLITGEDDDLCLAGLTDFGDALRNPLVCEPAIACAYAMLAREDPLPVARALVSGWSEEAGLTLDERGVLAALVETRLAVSVVHSARERTRAPSNAYLSVTEPHAWRLLEWFDRGGREALVDTLASTDGAPQ